MSHDIPKLINDIQSVLNDYLLTAKYAQLPRQSKTEGHCYAASEALYHMLGGKTAGYVPQVASFIENNEKLTHWWLKNQDGKIFDPTAEQFTAIGQKPPYELGKGAGFLTKLPSKRASTIIKRVLELTSHKELKIKPI